MQWPILWNVVILVIQDRGKPLDFGLHRTFFSSFNNVFSFFSFFSLSVSLKLLFYPSSVSKILKPKLWTQILFTFISIPLMTCIKPAYMHHSFHLPLKVSSLLFAGAGYGDIKYIWMIVQQGWYNNNVEPKHQVLDSLEFT